MKFTKMHGLGNDYVLVNCFQQTVRNAERLARAVCDRHQGIGGDGLILLRPGDRSDVRMEVYNADGSRAQVCGNGLRCVAKYAVEHGLVPQPLVSIQADAGVRLAQCRLAGDKVDSVRVDMGAPVLEASTLPATVPSRQIIDHPFAVGDATMKITCVSVGNPHAVVFVEALHKVPLVEIGPLIENAPEFPERINVHFVRVDEPDHVTVRTWERGSGATRACGSGACAVCVAGAITGRTDRKITATLPGGNLLVEWADDDHVHMTGPAVEVFAGEWVCGETG
jgi:diaminopimelate epimerase